jgi:hypothetical protein
MNNLYIFYSLFYNTTLFLRLDMVAQLVPVILDIWEAEITV